MSTDDKTLVPLQIDVLGVDNDEISQLIRTMRVQEDGFVVAADLVKAVDENFVINHCFYGALQAVMKQQQIQLEETDIYYLCNGPSIAYAGGNQYDTFGLDPMIRMLQEWNDHTGVDISYTRVDQDNRDHAAIVQEWYEVLSSGKTLLLHADTGSLNYNELLSASPGGGHVVQLYGLQPSEDIAYIIDHFLLDKAGKVLGYNGTVRISDLLEGLVEYGSIQSTPGTKIPPEQILSAAITHLEEFLSGGIDEHGQAHGIAAYRLLNTEMMNLSELDDEAFEEACGIIYYHLRVESLVHLLRYSTQLAVQHEALLGAEAPKLIRQIEQLQDHAQRLMMKLYKIGVRHNRSKLQAWTDSNRELLEHMELHLGTLVKKLAAASKAASVS
ncbi:BtrH N-terminal domain-containing protein [Paenibacillus kandeliae]|uniref:BtrH N-terminal domain-containing protein n=1 Tax=Paenibacillus kandeliae TaxID=3231269 RepID=UPI003458078C